MLQIRLEGDQTEALAFLDWIRAHGGEAQTGTVKARREGFAHVYGVVRVPGPAGEQPGTGPGTVWVASDRGVPALGRGRSRR